MAKPLSEQTDADIEAAMRSDPDWQDANGNLLTVDWSSLRFPDRQKHAVSIRLDCDVIAFFKGQGPGYQTRINAVLRHYMEQMK